MDSTTAATRPVYGYRYPDGDDPHAVVIAIGRDDAVRWQAAEDRLAHNIGRYDRGPWVTVTDFNTGERYDLRSAPCGLGCRCAAELRPALPVIETAAAQRALCAA